jgi:hypothetical protein
MANKLLQRTLTAHAAETVRDILRFVPSKENLRAACGELGRTKHALPSSLRCGLGLTLLHVFRKIPL